MNDVILISGWGHTGTFIEQTCGPFFDSTLAYGLEDLEGDSYSSSLLEKLERKDVILCGWSTGAMIALEAAIKAPDRVKALVLIAGTARYSADARSPFAVPPKELKALSLSCRRNPQETLEMFRRHAGTDKLAEGDIPQTTLNSGLEYLSDTDLRDKLYAVKCPVLIIHGRRDQVVPAESGRELASLITHAELVEIEEAYHACFLDAPEEIRHKIGTFLESL